MTAVKLSAVIISLNEERNIGECIDSLNDVADEIIVLDSFSTDKTEEICRIAEVRFAQREWEGYSAAKNHANALATGHYIISLDADEALSPELADSILKIRDMPLQDVAFTMNRLNSYFGRWIRHGDWYPDKKLRIFRSGTGHWEGIIHEKLILPRGTKIIHLKGDLHHNASSSISEYVRKSWHYAHLVARSDLEQGRMKSWLYHGAIKPFSLFVRSYFLKLGFLDGYRGLLLAGIAAWERHVRYVAFRKFKKQSRSSKLPV